MTYEQCLDAVAMNKTTSKVNFKTLLINLDLRDGQVGLIQEIITEAATMFAEQYKYDYSKSCRCEYSIGQTWCCNLCGLPTDNQSNKVELPTKEQVHDKAYNWAYNSAYNGADGLSFEEGAKWMREQLPSPPKQQP